MRTDVSCIIGAGAAGLATAKVFQQAGLPFEVLEAAGDVGGIWDAARADSPMSRNTHAIASKSLQRYPDLPVPDSSPDYPSHALVLRYLRSYADRFGLRAHIRLHARVARLEPVACGATPGWRVTLEEGTRREYASVIIATGHDRLPRMPRLPGQPTIEVLHASRYREPDQVLRKRVLVVGAGQSAADLLADCAVNAAATFHSTRRGFFCMPKYLLGRPTDTLLQGRAPRALRRLAYTAFFHYLRRRSLALGLPAPDFGGGLAIPVLGDLLHHHYTHGDIVHRGDVVRVDGDRAYFADGGHEQVDVVFLATGYLPSYPFVERRHLNWADGRLVPALYLHIFPREAEGLFVVGMVRPIGSHWDVYERQAELVAAYLRARAATPAAAHRFDRARRGPQPDLLAGLRFANAEQYPLIVEKQEYLHQLRRHLRLMGARPGNASRGPAGRPARPR